MLTGTQLLIAGFLLSFISACDSLWKRLDDKYGRDYQHFWKFSDILRMQAVLFLGLTMLAIGAMLILEGR